MKKHEKEILQHSLNSEEAVLKNLEKEYKKSVKEINKVVSELNTDIKYLQSVYDSIGADGLGEVAQAYFAGKGKKRLKWASNNPEAAKETLQSMIRSKVYQKKYQTALKKQVSEILNTMKTNQFKTISDYLEKSYEDGFVGAMYSLHKQGIPLIFPLDQNAMVKAIQIDSKISVGLYTKLGENVDELKKKITSEVTRGISTGRNYKQVAQQLTAISTIGFNKAVRIARTEGNRVNNQSAMDAAHKAKNKGCDVMKQWNAALDSRTRRSHAMVDGEIRELDEDFSNGLSMPSDPDAPAAEVVNCRCRMFQIGKWELDDEELDRLKERAAFYGLDKTAEFDDFKKKYLKAADEESKQQAYREMMTNRRKERMAARNTKNKTTVEFTPEMSADEIDKVGRHSLYGHWEEYRKKFLGNATPVDFEKLDNVNSFFYDSVKLGKYKNKEVVQKIYSQVDELSSRFYSPLQKLEWMDATETAFSNAFATTSTVRNLGTAEIRFNPVKFKDEGLQRVAELAQKGYGVKIPKGKEVEYLTAHEFGHSILTMGDTLPTKQNWVQCDFAPIKSARKEVSKIWDVYSSDVAKFEAEYKALKKEQETKFLFEMIAPTPDELKELQDKKNRLDATKISSYSLTNTDEFVAEAFADVVINGESAKQYSKDVYSIIVKYFGKE